MSTIIRLLPAQVPQVWDAIKLAAVRSQEVSESALPQTCLRLLHGLLSDTVQCLVSLDEDRTILQIALTQVRVHQITGQRDLEIIGLYSFKLMQEDDALASMDLFRRIARSQECQQIVVSSRNPRLWKLYETLGFTASHRSYVYVMGGTNGR